jgi:putative spermidine/putrescine transport system permease protein
MFASPAVSISGEAFVSSLVLQDRDVRARRSGAHCMSSAKTSASPQARLRRRLPLNWLGIMPFAIFVLLFLILPTMKIVVGAFQTPDGSFTFENIKGLFTSSILGAYWISIKISIASALLGCLIGFAVAAAVVLGGVPQRIRGPLLTFSGVASNFAGVPLAFAFLATLGPVGLVTVFLKTQLGIDLRLLGFNLLSFWGLTITYLFFQIPLMILIITPAIDGLKREWKEAAEILGATGAQYWRMVAFPILLPSLLGTLALLFANAFGAVATAIALTGSSLSIAPILLFAQIRGDVLGNPHLGYALAFGMIVVTGIANAIYIWLRARSERWLK